MRVLHVLESFAPGGMETTFLNVLGCFRAADAAIRHDVLAFAGGPLESRYRQVAETVTVGGDPGTLDRHLASGYDLIHILFERCAYRLLPLLVSSTATPVVYGKGYDLGGMYRLNEQFLWHADESMLTACDGITFTTGQLAAGYDVPSGRSTVLGKAADVSRFTTLAPPAATTPRRIVCIANLHARKRLGDLIEALAVIVRDVPDANLRLVGGGTAAEAIRLTTLAADLGLSDHVSLAGMTHDVAPEIAASRVIALPSSCEGVPTALLEGMAAARPAVATNVGHVSSIVDDGVEGFLVGLGDVDALADRLRRLLTNSELAASMGAAARRRAVPHDVSAVAAALLDALRAAA